MVIWTIKGKTATGIAIVVTVAAASSHEALLIAAQTLHSAVVLF